MQHASAAHGLFTPLKRLRTCSRGCAGQAGDRHHLSGSRGGRLPGACRCMGCPATRICSHQSLPLSCIVVQLRSTSQRGHRALQAIQRVGPVAQALACSADARARSCTCRPSCVSCLASIVRPAKVNAPVAMSLSLCTASLTLPSKVQGGLHRSGLKVLSRQRHEHSHNWTHRKWSSSSFWLLTQDRSFKAHALSPELTYSAGPLGLCWVVSAG